MTILFILTSHTQLGTTGQPTGTWLEELAAAYYVLQDDGYSIDLASIRGGDAPIDPASLEGDWLSDTGRRFLEDESAVAKLRSTPSIDTVDAAAYDAIYMVGGAGTAWDFPTSPALAKIAADLDARGAVVAGVCHGVLGLAGAVKANGSPLVAGRNVTGVSYAEEEMLGLEDVVPHIPETCLVALGGIYSAAQSPFGDHIVIDRNLLTGQNPASAATLARAISQKLKAKILA